MVHGPTKVIKVVRVGFSTTTAGQTHSWGTEGMLVSWDFVLTQWDLMEAGLTGFWNNIIEDQSRAQERPECSEGL